MENGHYYIFVLKKKIIDNLFLVNINIDLLQKEDGKINLDAFFRNGLCLHIILIIISIFVFIIEKQFSKSTDVYSPEDSPEENDNHSTEQ